MLLTKPVNVIGMTRISTGVVLLMLVMFVLVSRSVTLIVLLVFVVFLSALNEMLIRMLLPFARFTPKPWFPSRISGIMSVPSRFDELSMVILEVVKFRNPVS